MLLFLRKYDANVSRDMKRHGTMHVRSTYIHPELFRTIFYADPRPGCGRWCSLLPNSFIVNTYQRQASNNNEIFPVSPRGFVRRFVWVEGRLWCQMLHTGGNVFLMAQEQVSCRFCLFCFYAAVLTPRPCPPRFQADAAAAGVVGRDRAVRQGTAAGSSCGR